MDRILLGKYLITPGLSPQENWGVAVQDDTIVAVDDNEILKKKYGHFEQYDCTDTIISPGFINTHLHSYSLLARCKPSPPGISSFDEFLTDYWWPKIEDRIDVEMVESATRLSALELLNSGVTCFCDVLEAPHTVPGILDTQAQSLEDIGIRAVLCVEGSERLGSAHGIRIIDENRKFHENTINHPLISGMICVHTTYSSSKEYLKKVSNTALSLGAPIHLHLNESVYEPQKCLERYGMRPAELYSEIGLLDNDVLAAQAVKMSEREIDLLLENGTSVSHVPLSNCGFGCGIAPVAEMVQKGINVSLGTDGYINRFIEVMRGAFLLQKGYLEDPTVLSGQHVFEMATANGAKALKQAKIGRLENGSPADIITIDADFITPVDKSNLFEQIILHKGADDVKDVFVNGRVVKQSGRLLYGDINESRNRARESARRLWGVL